jgi:hypothetical protein
MKTLNNWRLILILQHAIINSKDESFKKYFELKKYKTYRLVR